GQGGTAAVALVDLGVVWRSLGGRRCWRALRFGAGFRGAGSGGGRVGVQRSLRARFAWRGRRGRCWRRLLERSRLHLRLGRSLSGLVDVGGVLGWGLVGVVRARGQTGKAQQRAKADTHLTAPEG